MAIYALAEVRPRRRESRLPGTPGEERSGTGEGKRRAGPGAGAAMHADRPLISKSLLAENIEALRQNPELAEQTPEMLSLLAYWQKNEDGTSFADNSR
ncbi:MAG: hypothetical protein LBL20_01225 [Treponema sp.]|jgi:hypothetical protein|nr:hypothetical protein [Treponema sp.]